MKDHPYQQQESALVQRCINGDSSAEKELYLKYIQAMYNTAIRMVGDADDTRDIMQEVFIKVFENLKNYRGDASLGSWIKRITIHSCINHFRKMKNLDEETVIRNLYTTNDLTNEIHKERISNIHEAIKQLPSRARLVFCMHILEGYTHEEIGRMLSITSSTSKTQFKRAKEIIQSLVLTDAL